MCRYSYYRFIFLTPLLFLSAGLFAQPSLENMNHRAEGFWRIKDTQAGNCSTCPPMHGTHYFYYKLGYVCLEIGRPERNPLAQRVKDVFRLQSRWEDNILYIRLPIGKWWPLAPAGRLEIHGRRERKSPYLGENRQPQYAEAPARKLSRH